LITGIENNNSQIPLRFSLDQNFPSPFNPSTVIAYQLPTHSFVILKIYDMPGRDVRTLAMRANIRAIIRLLSVATINQVVYISIV